MKRMTLVLAVLLMATIGTSAQGKRGGRQAEPLLAPGNVLCTIDGVGMEIMVSWDVVVGATKYAVDFECEDPTGTTEVEVDFEPEERLTDTTAFVPFDDFPVEVIFEGDGAYTCMAKVKGLNPPGRKQSHPQGVAICQ